MIPPRIPTPNDTHAAIAAMGQALGPGVLDAVQGLYRIEQDDLAAAWPVGVADVAYGEDPRHRLDLYLPARTAGPVPVLLWLHGGGFVRGEKRSAAHPFNAHVGRWAAQAGMVGAVMNYRLAPDHGWPAGGEDVAAAIDWLREHAAAHGGDPARIVVMGTSAGAVHVATLLRLRADAAGVRGAIMLSGLYGFTDLDDRDAAYYGDPTLYHQRWPREAVVATTLPLLLACAEFDPPRFQREFVALLDARLRRHGRLPHAMVAAGHNHFSLACHIGSADTQLTDAVLAFVQHVCTSTHG